jgi:hypothetical protein
VKSDGFAKSVIPAPDKEIRGQAAAGIQTICNQLKTLDSRFHGNDRKWTFETFCEFVKYDLLPERWYME